MRPIHEAYDSTKQQAGGTLEIDVAEWRAGCSRYQALIM